jgi:hypothetical protein
MKGKSPKCGGALPLPIDLYAFSALKVKDLLNAFF